MAHVTIEYQQDVPAPPENVSPPGARSALILLLGINLFNYVDRQVLAAVEPLLRDHFKVSQAQMGWLATAFLLSYMVFSPAFGWLGDRYSRWKLVAVGVILWSAASGATGLAPTFLVLLLGLAVARPRNQHTPRDVGLSYTVQRITIPDGGSVETWVIDQLQPRGVVILFPGYASSKDSLLAPAATLHARGYATVLVDFRGTGGSTGDDTTLCVREATDVAAVFADAQRS